MGKFLIKGLFAIFSALPLWVHHMNAIFLGWLVRVVVRYRVDVVRDNLKNAFPEKTADELKSIEKKFYRHFADIFTEAIWFGGSSEKRLHKGRIAVIQNPEELSRHAQNGKSVAVLYSHAGNWEILGGFKAFEYNGDTTLNHENAHCIYRQLSSKFWDEVMLYNRAGRIGRDNNAPDTMMLESKQMIRYMLTHRSEQHFYYINTDQRPYFDAPDYIMVDFLGRKVRTMSGGAAVAHKLGQAVVFMSMTVNQDHGYDISYTTICDDASQMSVEDIMKKYYELLEKEIIAQPENYLWTHRRWK